MRRAADAPTCLALALRILYYTNDRGGAARTSCFCFAAATRGGQTRDIARAKALAAEWKSQDMTIETTPWDPAERLTSPEAIAAYLEAVFEEGDPGLIAAALGDVARARGMTEVARAAGVTRDTLYKALTKDGDPRLSTFLGVAKALGLKIQVAA